jgi:RNA polymerase sigma factor (sigma-70 family)
VKNLDELIESNKGLVYKYLHKYNGVNNPDMISYGFEGLFKAAKTFDESKGYAFSTYACTCIFNSIGGYLRSIRNKPTEVSYEEYFSNVIYTHEDRNGLSHIMRIVKDTIDTYKGLDKEVLNSFAQSEFRIKQKDLATKHNCSQSKVSLILASFRAKLKMRVEAHYEDSSRNY